MSVDKISKREFDDIDDIVKENFNATIVAKFPLQKIGDWYREIDVSEDQQMFFLRTGSQAMPIKFNQIESAKSITIPYNAGKGAVRETDSNLGLTALGALCGWLVVSQTTRTKIKDRIIDLHAVKIYLRNHPTEKCAIYLCHSLAETIKVRSQIDSYLKQYEHLEKGQESHHDITGTGDTYLGLLGAGLFVTSPIWGFLAGSWAVFGMCALFGAFMFIIFVFKSSDNDKSNGQILKESLYQDEKNSKSNANLSASLTQLKTEQKKEPEEREGYVIFHFDRDKMDFALCLPEEYFEEARRKDYAYVPQDVWDSALKEFNERKEREERLGKTVELNNKGSEYEKNGDIDKAIECYEENLKIGYPALHSYDRLMILYRKLKRTEDEIRVVKLAIELFPTETKYVKRLKKLEGTEDPMVLPQVAIISHPRIVYGEKMEEEIKKLPEFDFYSKGYENTDYYQNYVSSGSLEPVWKIQSHFKDLLDSASAEEDYNNLAGASAIYEQIVAERYWMTAPYDKLIKIYSKAKLKEDEKRILTIAIDHFKMLKQTRYDYVHGLAVKYGAVDFFDERVKEDKKITYFSGVFELYNPFTIIPKWEERLAKLQ